MVFFPEEETARRESSQRRLAVEDEEEPPAQLRQLTPTEPPHDDDEEKEEERPAEEIIMTPLHSNATAAAAHFDEDFPQEIPQQHPVPVPLAESSPSSSDNEDNQNDENGDDIDDDDGIRTDYGTAGRHSRRRRLTGRRLRRGGNNLRQSLQRLRQARQGSMRLRATTMPVRTPLLRRVATSGSATQTPDVSADTVVQPPSLRSTKSTGSRAAARVDHLRNLVYRRLIQAGLLSERLDNDSPRAALFSSDDEGDVEDDMTQKSARTLRGWQIRVPRQTSPEQEANEPEGMIVGGSAEGAPSSPLRTVKEGSMASPGLVAQSVPPPPVLEAMTPAKPSSVAGGTVVTSSISKPSLIRRVSSLTSISFVMSGKKTGSAHSSIADNLDEDVAYLLGGKDEYGWGAEGFITEEDKEDERMWEEIRQKILQEGRFSDLSGNLQQIFDLMEEYAVLFPKAVRDVAYEDSPKLKDKSDALMEEFPVQVRLHNVTYSAKQPMAAGGSKIPTVYNTSMAYPIIKSWKRFRKEGFTSAWNQLWAKPDYEMVDILQGVNLVLQPGRSYLVLGPPGSGKTSLLKVIAGRLRPTVRQEWVSTGEEGVMQDLTSVSCNGSVASKPCEIPDKPCIVLQGRVQYNGRTIPEGGKEFFIENAMVYIDQLDQHAPRLTVDETFEFAFQCKTGGNMFRDTIATDIDVMHAIEKARSNRLRVNVILQALGLTHVRDTYVGDHSVRGISGGQRRRVTVGEMLMDRAPVLCGDEISTGLDAASTYDMIETLLYFGRLSNITRVIALLQPSPETVSLFDEVILLGEGKILYAGPMEDVEGYFADLGYKSPEFMDVADFLQQVSTEDGAELYAPSEEMRRTRPQAPTIQELADIFRDSTYGQRIRAQLKEPHHLVWRSTDEGSMHGVSRISGITKTATVTRQYANTSVRSTWLVTQRFFVLWTRDLRVIIAAAVKNVLMGVSVGGVFTSTTDEISIMGALFQAGLFIMLGAIQASSSMISDRMIFYKHTDANFYSAWPFVVGRTLSNLPQAVADVVLFGTILYYMVGLAGREDIGNFFVFLSILIVFSLVMQQQLAVFAVLTSSSGLQIFSSILLLFLILFGGFIVTPDAIPLFWTWMYWWNPFAWAFRALVINEFRSERWPNPADTLERVGFGRESEQAWVAFAFVYLGVYFFVCCFLTALGLTYVRNTGQGRPVSEHHNESTREEGQNNVTIPFKPVELTFHDICYEVRASKGNGTLRLLNNVNGIFRAGRMCALMGSSGAGKSTLMDVIAGRKSSGTVLGEVRLNGFLQDPMSFRRASGYVEQFDVQSPELTVLETVEFSAKLRIDRELVENEEDIHNYVEAVLRDVELDDLAEALVGDDEGSGLSFEQKKRLSIAVELAASPSIIFLDEPTSGLDARSALLVVKTLRRIADDGRTVCATIHQPSSTVFDMFDDLLLLKKGGEVVYHGPTGKQSFEIVQYFESLGAPRIELGENPANWMLRVMGNEELGDLAIKFRLSSMFRQLKETLEAVAQAEPDPSKMIQYEEQFATSKKYRQSLVTKRVQSIYWRSPAYNLARMTVSATVAFVLGSLFLSTKSNTVFAEVDIRARLSVIFLSYIITGMLAIFGSIPVMTRLRDMFYRHRTSGMYGSSSIGLALGAAEKPFIVLSTAIFTVIFLVTGRMYNTGLPVGGYISFWGFFTFNFAIYSYFGQAFVSLVKPTATALILSSVFIGLNNFFSGLIVRPQFMVGTFFAVPYYITPGHFVYEGLVESLYYADDRKVQADKGSEYWWSLVEGGECLETDDVCIGTVDDFVNVFFGNEFSNDHTLRNALILAFVLILARVVTWFSLKYVRFRD